MRGVAWQNPGKLYFTLIHVLYCFSDILDLITLEPIRIHVASYPPRPGLSD